MVIWLLRKVNNVTVVTKVICHASGMIHVVKVAMGLGPLSQETVSFCQEAHAGWSLFFRSTIYTRCLMDFLKGKERNFAKANTIIYSKDLNILLF